MIEMGATTSTDAASVDEQAIQDEDDRPLVSYVVATYNRKDDLAEAIQSVLDQSYPDIEVVVVSNATDGTSALFEDGARFDREEVTYLHFEGRMGVPEARNVGYDAAAGEILVTIDDDAVLRDADATERVVAAFERHPEAGVLAFQSRDYYSDELVRQEIPDPPVGETAAVDESYETTFFVGVGNAIRREVLEDVGGYPGDFEYGFEEMDLSLRVLDAGYGIRYLPSVAVGHKKTAAGRSPDQESLANQLENRLRILVRNLPWHCVAVSAALWSLYTVVRAGFTVEPVADALRRVFDARESLLADRSVVDRSTLERVRSMGGMFLWWYGPDPRRFLEEDVGLDRLTW